VVTASEGGSRLLHAAPCGGTHVRSLGDLADVVLPTLKVNKGRIRVSYTATHRSR
jgi:Ser-tRNA(Ala) deacylase AlaX